ncbi:CBS domain-containing protein [Oscillochloris sp. ZM17-4]|uniref:CBS domain-containing protein n=1 Tax=Oscillochloris sp. ZM17-4 TaxID=2866714 RepID=UPI001C73C06B|nr:CBS domain-containing protein [Oscillochloris sp. ZM17-4]MBX0328078.1 CBS domain-containing protein [Oscillochloris sp. ZM17-4]
MNSTNPNLFLPSLDDVTNTDLQIIDLGTPVRAIIEQLNQQGATFTLIRAAGQITGTLTIHDVVQMIADGPAPDSLTLDAAAGRPLISIARDAPDGVLDALRLLAQHQTGQLIVRNADGSIAGMISQESICAAMTPAMLIHMRTVAEAMRTEVISVGAEESLLSIARRMGEGKVSSVVVVAVEEGGARPLGMITDRDITRAHAAQIDLAATPARAQITPQLITITPDASLWDAHQALDRAHVRRLIVVDSAGYLVGLLTHSNLLNATAPQDLQRTFDLLQRSVSMRTAGALTPRPAAGGDAQPRSGIRLLLVDDNGLFLQVIHRLLVSRGFTVAGVAGSGQEAIRQSRALQPDIILMDVEMPEMSGLEATRAIMDERPDARIVMLTVAEDDDTLFEAVRHGAAGYLLKDVDIDQLSQYILGLMRGEAALSPVLAQRVLSALASQMRQDSALQPDPSSILTHHQIRILTLLAQGNTYKEIGRILGYSERAIKYHTGESIRQLKLKDRAEAIAYARAHMQRATWPNVGDP